MALAFTAALLIQRRCNHAVALHAVEEAYGWVQHAVARQCSHVPDESFARHSHAHHAVLAVPPLQLYRHNIACTKKTPCWSLRQVQAGAVLFLSPSHKNPFILNKTANTRWLWREVSSTRHVIAARQTMGPPPWSMRLPRNLTQC